MLQFLSMKEIVIDHNNSGQKAEKFVKNYLKEAPLGFIYKAFRKKDIKRNGHWINKDEILHEGDILRIYVTDQQLADFLLPVKANKKPLSYPIVYEDRNVLIVNKPSGLLVVGEGKDNRKTLANEVVDYLYYKGEYDPNAGSFRPSPAHRLDRNTSGLVVFGKTDAALKGLTEIFKNRENICKSYLALVVGELAYPGRIALPLRKDPHRGFVSVCPLERGGKEAITEYRPLHRYDGYTLLEVSLLTGRTHQIRVHMASVKHPLVGDAKYGDFATNRLFKSLYHFDHQFLHAYKISFGKTTGVLEGVAEKTFEAPLATKESELLSRLRKLS